MIQGIFYDPISHFPCFSWLLHLIGPLRWCLQRSALIEVWTAWGHGASRTPSWHRWGRPGVSAQVGEVRPGGRTVVLSKQQNHRASRFSVPPGPLDRARLAARAAREAERPGPRPCPHERLIQARTGESD